MIALILVLFVSLIVAGGFLGGFLWSVRTNQFEDKEGSAMRMLYDDEPIIAPTKSTPEQANHSAISNQ